MSYSGKVTFWGGINNAEESLGAFPPDSIAAYYPPYHSPEWWDMMWKKHEAWREGNYPVAAGTGFEVTPPTGIDMTEPIRYNQIKAGKAY